MKPCNLLLYCSFFALSCSSDNHEESYMSFNSFNRQPGYLKDGEKIRVLFCSSQNNPNINQQYLIQFVAVRAGTRDTVNILCPASDQVEADDGDELFYFEDMEEELSERIRKSDAFVNKLRKTDTAVLPKDLENASNSFMVRVDMKYKGYTNNNYPTVVGMIR